MSKKKRKRSKTTSTDDNDTHNSKLPTKLLQSLESSDRRASKLLRSEISIDTLPKSQAAQSLLSVQTHLMECRILLQKALTSLPSLGHCSAGDGGADEKRVVKKAADRLLMRLLEARKTLYPNLTKSTDDTNDDDSDDEDNTKQKYSRLIQNTNSSSPHTAIEKTLDAEYNALQPTWQSILDRRHVSLRLSSGGAVTSNSTQFKVIDRSFWAQVEGTVRHDAALLPRPTPDAVPNALPPRPSTSLPPTPPSLFDDSKIYRHMLQDFLTLSTEGHRSGEGGAAEAAATRLRRVMEKQRRRRTAGGGGDVDRKASKGRKIRYVVYPKLAHFTFPVERRVVGEGTGIIDEDVLFRSMFGGVSAGRRRKV